MTTLIQDVSKELTGVHHAIASLFSENKKKNFDGVGPAGYKPVKAASLPEATLS